MSGSFSESISTSWFGRIGSSFKGILFGGLLFLLAFPLLFWNEGRAVRTAKGLKQGLASVVSYDSPEKVLQENEGKLVHLSGLATTTEELRDEEFGVFATGIALLRRVEMYQWKEKSKTEKEKKLGGKEETITTYAYEKVWSESPIDSSEFKKPAGHVNPTSLPFSSSRKQAQQVTLGAFQLSDDLVKKISRWQPLPVEAARLPAAIAGKSALLVAGNGYYLPTNRARVAGSVSAKAESTQRNPGDPFGNSGDPSPREAQPGDPGFNPFGAADPAGGQVPIEVPLEEPGQPGALPKWSGQPEVGDVRITFEVIKPTEVSIVSQQQGNSFTPFITASNTRLNFLDFGRKSAQEMFADQVAKSKFITWILRSAGFLMMTIGLTLIVRPLTVLADVVPFIGNIVGTGSLIVAGIVAAGLTLLTISFAWIFYRPLLGIPLLVLGVGLIGLVCWLLAGRKSDRQIVAGG